MDSNYTRITLSTGRYLHQSTVGNRNVCTFSCYFDISIATIDPFLARVLLSIDGLPDSTIFIHPRLNLSTHLYTFL